MYFIFDFDGTIIDSFQCVIEKFNLLSKTFKFKEIPLEEANSLKNFSIQEIIQQLNIPLYKIPPVLRLARKYLHEDMNTLSPFNHVASVLKSLVDSGMTLGILTSNSKENVVSWLNHQKISELFTFVYAESPLFGKKNLLKRVIKKNKMPREKTYYIGDEVRDIEAAKKCGIYSVAVTWGFNSAKILSEHHPDFLIDHPQELLQIK